MAEGGKSSSRARETGPPVGPRRRRIRADATPIERLMVGWREWVELPELGGARVKAKVDTGARTSAIHAWNIESYERHGAPWIKFEIHPVQGSDQPRLLCDAPVHDERMVRSSSGQAERRFVILTTLSLGGESWPIELSLARRDEMGFRMLIGRTALHRRAVVDPSRSFLSVGGRRRISKDKG